MCSFFDIVGLACEKLGERAEATSCYERALRAVPSDACARVRLAACARAAGQMDSAAHWFLIFIVLFSFC